MYSLRGNASLILISSAKYVFPYVFAYGQHCNTNTAWTINYAPNMREANIHMWTTQGLSIGDKLRACFDQANFVQYGTHERRTLKHLHFQRRCCECERCKDPTELGSMASALRCSKCQDGFVLPLNPLEDDSAWKCTYEACAQQMESQVVFNNFHAIAEEIRSAKDSIGSLLKLLKKHKQDLHPQHYLIARAADRIVELGWLDIKSKKFESMNMYNFKPLVEAANICLSFADVVSPGLTRQRGNERVRHV